MGLRFTCAVTPSSRSRMACRKPVFIDKAITNVVTPAATPTTASSVTIRKTAGRFGDRKYRNATSHSNVISSQGLLWNLLRGVRRTLYATTERVQPRVSHGNPSAASPAGRFPRLPRQWAAAREKAREYNPCPLL